MEGFAEFFEIGDFQSDDGGFAPIASGRSDFHEFRTDRRTRGKTDFHFFGDDHAVFRRFEDDFLSYDYRAVRMSEHDGGVPRVDSGVRRLSFHLDVLPFRENFPADEVTVDLHDSRIGFQSAVNVLFGPYRTRGIRAGTFVHVAFFFDRPFENQVLTGDFGIDSAMVDDFFAYADDVRFRVDVHVTVHGRYDKFATALVDDFRSRSGR